MVGVLIRIEEVCKNKKRPEKDNQAKCKKRDPLFSFVVFLVVVKLHLSII